MCWRFQHNLQPHSTVFVLDNLEGDCVPRRTLPKWVSVSLRAEALSPQNPASGSGHGAGCGRAGGQGWCPPAHFPPSLHPASSLPVPPNRSVGEASPGDLLLPGLLWLSLWTAPLPSDSSSWDGVCVKHGMGLALKVPSWDSDNSREDTVICGFSLCPLCHMPGIIMAHH